MPSENSSQTAYLTLVRQICGEEACYLGSVTACNRSGSMETVSTDSGITNFFPKEKALFGGLFEQAAPGQDKRVLGRCSLGRQPIHFLKVVEKTKGF